MGLFSKLKDQYTLKCSECGKAIKPGEFMCIIAKSPKKGYYGVTEVITNRLVKETGDRIYCESCFNKKYR